MKSLVTLLVVTVGTWMSTQVSAQTVTSRLNDILASVALIEDAVDEARDARDDFFTQIIMGSATAGDATNFRNRITAAMVIVEEQQDEIQFFITNASQIDPTIDPNPIRSRAAEVEGLEDEVQNRAEDAKNAFLAGDINGAKGYLNKVKVALNKQQALLNQIKARTNALLAQQ